jgi:hypothetical protein
MRILITGSRAWTDRTAIATGLTQAIRSRNPRPARHQVTIVHGAARGADTIAAEIAAAWGCNVEDHPVTRADWDAPCTPQCQPGHRRTRRDGTTYCPAAGTRRNQHMVDSGADLCIGFPLSTGWSGTRDCMTRAVKAGIRVIDWPAQNHQPSQARKQHDH